MADVLRVGDTGSGTCSSHDSPINVTGTIGEGFDGFDAEGEPLAGNGHRVDLDCGHTGTLIASVNSITCNGISVGKSGDSWTNGSGATTGTITNTYNGFKEG